MAGQFNKQKLIEDFKSHLTAQKVKPSDATVKNYVTDLAHFLTWLSNSPEGTLEKTSPKTLEDFRKFLTDQNYAPQTIDRHFSTLRKFFNSLSHGVVKSNIYNEYKVQQNETSDPFKEKAFQNYLKATGKEKATITNYLSDISHFLNWLSKVTQNGYHVVSEDSLLEKITPTTLTEYRDRLQIVAKLSPRSINRKLSSLRLYTNWLTTQGFIKANPFISQQPIELVAKEGDEFSEVSSYSSFAPFRLAQKLYNIFDTLFVFLLISPFSNLILKLQGSSGRHTYVRNENSLPNIEKELYAPSKISLKDYSFSEKIIHHIKYSRPAWFREYMQTSFAPYINFSVLFIALLLGGLYLYNHLPFLNSSLQPNQDQLTATSTGPPKTTPHEQVPKTYTVSARLTDKEGNAITTPQMVIFSFYGSPILFDNVMHQEAHEVTPNSEGYFKATLDQLPQTLVFSPSPVYVGIAIKDEAELKPRQMLTSLLAGQIDSQHVIPFQTSGLSIDANGSYIFPQDNPTIAPASGSLTIGGSQLVLQTNSGTAGSIVLNPDTDGNVDILAPITNSVTGLLNFKDGISINTTSSQTPLAISYEGAQDAISIQNGSSPLFSLDAGGNTTVFGGLAVSGNTRLSQNLTVLGDTHVFGNLENMNVGGLYAIWYDDTNTLGQFQGRPIKQSILPTSSYASISPSSTVSQYSSKIIGYIKPTYSEDYTIYITAANGIRAYVNHQKLIDSWSTQNNNTHQATIHLTSNQWTPIIIEHYNQNTSDSLTVEWQSNSQPRQTIPGTSLAFSQTELPQTLYAGLRIDGDMTISGNTTIGGSFTPNGNGSQDLGSSSNYFRTLYVNNIIGPATGIAGFIQRNNGAISPTNITDDILVGSTSTSSALIKLSGTNGDSFFNGGNVAIGTSSASQPLTVYGVARFAASNSENIDLNANISSAGETNIIMGTSGRIAGEAGEFRIGALGRNLAFAGGTNGQNDYVTIYNTSGNIGINGGGSSNPITVGTDNTNGNGASLTAGGAWTNGSSRLFKENFGELDSSTILNKINQLSIMQWNYKTEDPSIKHIGPFAEDFYSIFGVGNDPRHISTIDPAGIALVGVQELSKELASVKNQHNGLISFDTDTRNFQLLQAPLIEQTPRFTLFDAAHQVINKTLALSDSIIANLTAGTISVHYLSVGQEFVSPVGTINTLHANLITPLPQSNGITLLLSKASNQTVSVTDETGHIVASIDSSGNANFSGTINSTKVAANSIEAQQASISGILRVQKIIADSIVNLSETTKQGIQQGVEQQNIQDNLPSASSSASLAMQSMSSQHFATVSADTITVTEGFLSLGPAGFKDVAIEGLLSMGTNFFIQDNSINVVGADLQLQSLRQGGVSIADGGVVIDKDGNMSIQGNVAIAGNISAQTASIYSIQTNMLSPIPSQDLVIKLGNTELSSLGQPTHSNFVIQDASGSSVLVVNDKGDVQASGSGTFKDVIAQKLHLPELISKVDAEGLTIQSNGSIGKGVLRSNTYEITITSPLVTRNSLIYITPTSDTDNQVPYIARIVEGKSFTIAVSNLVNHNIQFNWWIVN